MCACRPHCLVVRTFHEHENVRRIVVAGAVLRERELDGTKGLANCERSPVGVVRGDGGCVRLDLRIERSRPRERVLIVTQERRQLQPKSLSVEYHSRKETRDTHDVRHGSILAPEVQTPVLAPVVRNDILDRGVTNVADGVDDSGGRIIGKDGTQVVRKREDGPVVRDGTEVGVLCVREGAVVNELRADDDVLAGLIGEAVRLRQDGQSMAVNVDAPRVDARSRYHSMRSPLKHTDHQPEQHSTYSYELTLDVVADLSEICLLRELHLVEHEISTSRRPIHCETVVPGHPFCADVRVYGDNVRVTVVGRRRDCHVREGKGLVKQIAWLRPNGGEHTASGGSVTIVPPRGLGTRRSSRFPRLLGRRCSVC